MARALQRIMRKNQAKVKYADRKAALLINLASHNHKAIAELLKKWLSHTHVNEKKI
jgi:hypothetical protein